MKAEIEKVKEDASEKNIDLSDLKVTTFAWPHGTAPSKRKRKAIDDRFKGIADFGFNAGKVSQEKLLKNEDARKKVKRIYIGPNTGFEQYAP